MTPGIEMYSRVVEFNDKKRGDRRRPFHLSAGSGSTSEGPFRQEISHRQVRRRPDRIDSRLEMRKLGCLLVVAQLITNAADAHSWYPKECCSDHDCQPVPCAELTKGKEGLNWRDRVTFSQLQIHDSPDDQCHVCVMSSVGYV